MSIWGYSSSNQYERPRAALAPQLNPTKTTEVISGFPSKRTLTSLSRYGVDLTLRTFPSEMVAVLEMTALPVWRTHHCDC